MVDDINNTERATHEENLENILLREKTSGRLHKLTITFTRLFLNT